MKWQKMVKGEPVAPEKALGNEGVLGFRAQRGGLLLTRARLGDIVDEGAYLCSIVNIYGDEVETITARGMFGRSTTLSTVSRGERASTLGLLGALQRSGTQAIKLQPISVLN